LTLDSKPLSFSLCGSNIFLYPENKFDIITKQKYEKTAEKVKISRNVLAELKYWK
jgi:hypothetical protein